MVGRHHSALFAEQSAKQRTEVHCRKQLLLRWQNGHESDKRANCCVADARRSSISVVLLVGWMVWEPKCMQSHCSREVRGAESPKVNAQRGRRRSHYCEDCGQVPEYISLLFNFISNLFTPATMWRSLSSSQVRNNCPPNFPSLRHVSGETFARGNIDNIYMHKIFSFSFWKRQYSY